MASIVSVLLSFIALAAALSIPQGAHHIGLARASSHRTYTVPLHPALQHLEYTIPVTFNGETRYMLLDTGSGDTWMIGPNFQCVTAEGKPQPQKACNFGPAFKGHIEPLPDKNFLQTYGNGNSISGRFGFANVTVAGLTVPHQQVSIVNTAYYQGDGVTSGVIGMSPRRQTNQYNGTDPSKDKLTGLQHYSPIFESMYSRLHAIPALFSLALQRGKNAGYLSLGGLPPVKTIGKYVSTPFKGLIISSGAPPDSFYPIQPDGLEIGGKKYSTTFRAIVDSGTYALRLPAEFADKINALYDPPAKYNSKLKLYHTSCNATVPKLGVKIAGKTFTLHQSDMLFPSSGLERCLTSVTRSFVEKGYPDGFSILGDVFLHNVVAVFDTGCSEMRFAEHQY